MPFRAKVIFEPGENILCFEPDPTKARVLYDAKILGVGKYRTKNGKKKPEYHVHFHGWNNSWDRQVPYSFVLKDNDDNRALKRKLAATARLIRRNKTRKKKIDDLLRKHFKHKLEFDWSDMDLSDGSEDAEDSEEEEAEPKPIHEFHDTKEKPKDEYENENRGTYEDETDSEVTLKSPVPESPAVLTKQAEPFVCDLEIQDNLKKKLDDDNYFINKKKKLVKLPAEPNVITLLEGYVKNFMVNILCATTEKLRPRDTYGVPPEKNVNMCKEVVDGLRVIFDFTLPVILLYGSERAQYKELHMTRKPEAVVKADPSDGGVDNIFDILREEFENMSPSPCTPRRRSSARVPVSTPTPSGEPPSKQLRLASRSPRREEGSDEETPSRRMTRHAFAKELKKGKTPESVKSRDHTPSSHREPRKSHSSESHDSVTDSARKTSLRSRTRHASGASGPLPEASKIKDSPQAGGDQAGGVALSAATPSSNKASTSESDAGGATNQEATVSNVFEWKLIPESVYSQTPTPPSIVYGAQHLLRLFVKLPDLLVRMGMPEDNLSDITRHLELFLEYLSARSDDLFPESVYIDNPAV